MQSHVYVAIVTLLAVLVYFWMAARVARTRRQVGIFAPAMTGDPLLERTIRAHYNTLEWLPIFLPSLWLFAIYWSSPVAAGLGLVWVVGRIVYFIGYRADAAMRRPGLHKCLHLSLTPNESSCRRKAWYRRVSGCCAKWPRPWTKSRRTARSSSFWKICTGAIRQQSNCSSSSRSGASQHGCCWSPPIAQRP